MRRVSLGSSLVVALLSEVQGRNRIYKSNIYISISTRKSPQLDVNVNMNDNFWRLGLA